MIDVLFAATLAVSGYSLWVRRDTWWSRWEIGASLAIALEVCALLLMSPVSAPVLGPALHELTGVWNVQQLLGHVCLMLAVAAITYHVLLRLTEIDEVRSMVRRYVTTPIAFGVAIMVTIFCIADIDYREDLFSGSGDNRLLNIYWIVVAGILVYLSVYSMRAVVIARSDPRARETADIYLISASFGMVAVLIQVMSVWTGDDVSAMVWFFACLAISSFALGSARSWQAKSAWFTPPRDRQPPPPPAPPELRA